MSYQPWKIPLACIAFASPAVADTAARRPTRRVVGGAGRSPGTAGRALWNDPAIRGFSGPAENSWDFNLAGSIFGFGPMRPDDDIGLLWAQAVGHRPGGALEKAADGAPR